MNWNRHCGHISPAPDLTFIKLLSDRPSQPWHASHNLVGMLWRIKIPLFILSNERSLWAHQISYLWGHLPPSKTVGHEDDQSPPYSSEVKNKWSHNSAVSHVFMACKGTAYASSLYWHSKLGLFVVMLLL